MVHFNYSTICVLEFKDYHKNKNPSVAFGGSDLLAPEGSLMFLIRSPDFRLNQRLRKFTHLHKFIATFTDLFWVKKFLCRRKCTRIGKKIVISK